MTLHRFMSKREYDALMTVEVLSIKNYQQAEQFASMIVQETDLMQKK